MLNELNLEATEPVLFSILRNVRSTLTRTEFFSHAISEYSKEIELSIWVGTFNLNGQKCNQSIKDWLPSPNDPCDIFCFAFQEIVELSPSNALLGSSSANVDAMDSLLATTLNSSGNEYLKLTSVQLVGLYFIVYVKAGIQVTQVETSALATGYGGMIGNKGAVGVRMMVKDRPLALVNVHLSSGEKSKDCAKRQTEVEDILNRIDFGTSDQGDETNERQKRNQRARLSSDPNVIFFGDMNFRLDGVPDADARAQIAQGHHASLFVANDQLHTLMKNGSLFQGFVEGPVSFAPTFKFKLGTSEYSGDSMGEASGSTKKRVPAWCDRIVFRSSNLQQKSYYSAPSITASDHKPVASRFSFTTVEFNRDKIKELLEKCKRDAELKLAADRPRCPPLKPNTIDLGVLHYGERRQFKVTVSNTGKLDGNFHWVPPPSSILTTNKSLEEDEPPGLPPWIHSYPDEGCVPCGGSKSIELAVCVDREALHMSQGGGSEVPSTSIFILRVEDASDLFLVVNVDYRKSRLFGPATSSVHIIRGLVLFLLREDLNHLATPGLLTKSLISLLPPNIKEERATRSAFSREDRPLLFGRLAWLIQALEESDSLESEDRSLVPEGTNVMSHEAAGLLLLYLAELPAPLLSVRAVSLLTSSSFRPSDPNEALMALSEVLPPTEVSALKLVLFLAERIVTAKSSPREEMIETLIAYVGPRHVQGEIKLEKIKVAVSFLI